MFKGEAYIVTKDAQVCHALRYVESGDNCVVAEWEDCLEGCKCWGELEVDKIFGMDQKKAAWKYVDEVQEARLDGLLFEEDQIVEELKKIFRMGSFSPCLIDRALEERWEGCFVASTSGVLEVLKRSVPGGDGLL